MKNIQETYTNKYLGTAIKYAKSILSYTHKTANFRAMMYRSYKIPLNEEN